MTVGCRYDLGADHARDKERYAAKEREEVILRARERKMAEMHVEHMCILINISCNSYTCINMCMYDRNLFCIDIQYMYLFVLWSVCI